jgi:chromosomal replication initiation ATPase DnaA
MLQIIASAPVEPAERPSHNRRLSQQRTCRWVAFCVARDFGLELRDLFGPTRGPRRAAFARQAAMYLAHTSFELSHGTISLVFHRDRTTVLHACRAVEDRREHIELDCRLAALERFCKSGWSGLLQTTPEFAR